MERVSAEEYVCRDGGRRLQGGGWELLVCQSVFVLMCTQGVCGITLCVDVHKGSGWVTVHVYMGGSVCPQGI